MASLSVTSAAMPATVAPVSVWIFSAASAARAPSREQRKMRAPSRANSSAAAKPRPLLAAATRATRSVNPRSMFCVSDRLVTNWANLLIERIQARRQQMPRLVIEKHLRPSRLGKLMQQVFDFIGNAAGLSQTANDFAFVVRDRELIQRAHCPCDEEHNIARPHQHDVAPFQTKAGIDQHVAGVGRQAVTLPVVSFVACW